ncbi:MAG: glycosyltransferase family 39 protein [Rhodanobacteraceae bacterium]
MSDSRIGEGNARHVAHAARSPLLRLILLGLVLGFAFQGTRGLWSPDEGRYVDGALQMLDSGNYLAPGYSPDRVNFSKPPVTYWIIAASIRVFGRNTWAARMPYALAFVLTLWLLYAMGKQLTPEKPWLPGLVYACAIFPFFATNIISTDVFLTLFEALAMFGFMRWAFTQNGRERRRYAWLMWLGFGLAFMTKGPPGLTPLLAVVPFIVGRDGWRGLGRLFSPLGLCIFFVVALFWYLVAVLRYPWLVRYFLDQEVYQRLFTAVQRRHPGAFGWLVVYLPTLVLGSLPWWPKLIREMRAAASFRKWKRWRQEHTVEFFLALWFFVPLVMFCLVQSRLPLYILPLFLPLSLLLALALRKKINLGKARQRAWLCAWVIVLLALKGGIAYFVHSTDDNRLAARQLAALTHPYSYSAVAFIESTDLDYDVEEQTPWGMRLYVDKPIYGIAWRSSQSNTALCRALRDGSTLLVVDPPLRPDALKPALAGCAVRDVVRLGKWRNSALEWVQS